MSRYVDLHDRCDTCGRFVSQRGPGVSWSQQWSYGAGGTPDLHDPTYRCTDCTDRLGVEPTNCHGNYNGRNPFQPDSEPELASEVCASVETREAPNPPNPMDRGRGE